MFIPRHQSIFALPVRPHYPGRLPMYDFYILDLNERAGLLLKKGQFLMKARSDDFSFSLFSFKDFYVEVVMKNPGNKITQIVPFNSGWRLDKYLDEIEISGELLIGQE